MRKLFSVWIDSDVKQKIDSIPKAIKWALINDYLAKVDFSQFNSLSEKFKQREIITMYLEEEVINKIKTNIRRGELSATLSNILKQFEL
jgi:hypothetical protein